MTLTTGALFAGYGGIELAVEDIFGARPAWVSEFDKAPSRILAHHWPDAPNLGDVTKVDWANVEPVDIITGGSPCQDLSHAGKRAGMKAGTRSGLWASMCDAIDILRPSLVIWENVRGALSAPASSASDLVDGPGPMGTRDGGHLRALGRVLGDLADIGYDAAWCGLRAADVGAPHGRFRIFVIAWPVNDPAALSWPVNDPAALSWPVNDPAALLPSPRTSDTNGAGVHGTGGLDLRTAVSLLPTPQAMDTTGAQPDRRSTNGYGPALRDLAYLLPTPSVADATGGHANRSGDRSHELLLPGVVRTLLPTPTASDSGASGGAVGSSNVTLTDATERTATRGIDFGAYTPAITRWEALTRPAPSPTEPTGRDGAHRLSPRFVEWMQGLPDGWVTDVDISRNEQLKALGNGVVPQQGAAAIRHLLGAMAAHATRRAAA